MRFRPCIDLRNGRVVQIVGSTLRDDGTEPETHFVSEEGSARVAARYAADGLSGGHVIMLGKGNEAAATEALKAFPGGLQVGGGITEENAGSFLEAGASHVIVTSYVFRDGKVDGARLDEMIRVVGKDQLVLDLSCRRRDDAFYVVTDRWQRFTALEVNAATIALLAGQCDEFLVHGVDVEGLRVGIDDPLVKLLGQHCPIPVTYAGGATALSDLDRVKALGGGRVDLTIGSALDLFGGDVAYAEVVAWQRRENGGPA